MKIANLSNVGQGIFFGVLSCLFASVLVTIARYLSQDFHIFFIVMVRNFFGLLFFLPQIIKSHRNVFETKILKTHVFRGINGFIGMVVWFYAISITPLPEAISLSFVAPILTTIAAIIFLKEKVKKSSWIGILIGFIGIIIILRPGFREFKTAYFYCMISTSMWAITNILIKTMTKTEKPQTIVVYMSLIMLLISIPFALPYLKPLNMHSFFWFAMLGLASNLTHTCISLSYSKADLSVLQPVDFTRLIFTSIIAYFVFGEIVDFWIISGSIVILLGVIITNPNNKWQKKHKDLPENEPIA